MLKHLPNLLRPYEPSDECILKYLISPHYSLYQKKKSLSIIKAQ